MDYKKKYEEALNAARKFKNDCPSLWDTESNPFRGVFEELEEESEDEKIRKGIIEYLEQSQFGEEHYLIDDDIVRGYIAWLEKQGEQKPEIKYIYPKFRVGDVIEPVKPNGYYAPVRVKYIGEGNYSCESDDCKSFLSFPICNENEYVLTEQKSTWSVVDDNLLNFSIENLTELKNNFGDGYGRVGDCILWLKSLKERMKGE